MTEVAFDEARHEYRLDGNTLPSVTQVLGILMDFGGVPAEALARAAEFGTHVHQAIDLDNKRVLDEASLDPALRPYLVDGWRKFLVDTGALLLESERRMADPKLGFAGTLDSVVLLRGKRVLVDVKTGVVPRTVGPQLAAYAHLYQSATHNRIDRRVCLQLTGDGYRVHDCTNPADWSVFLSALNCWRFINAA